MQVVMSDPDKGMVHKHIHVRKPDEHFIANKEINNLYPSMAELMQDSQGLNLRFRPSTWKQKRTDYAGKKTATWREKIVKHRTLGIIFIAATLAAHAQQPQKAQPDDLSLRRA